MSIRVAQVTRFGGPEVLVTMQAPDPLAGPGQVVIDVTAADTLFVETAIRRGLGREYWQMTPPYVPGAAVAGQVRAVGHGVAPGWVGRRVTARTDQQGGYAEQAVARAAALVPVPDGLGLREAVSLLHDGVTALALLEGTPVREGDRVLVTAAAGGLGVLLVELAHAAGAQVVGAARGGRKLDLIAGLGADAVVDYSEPGWPDRVRDATGGHGPDVVFDGAGGEIGQAAFRITARGGRFSAHGAAGGFAKIDRDDAARRGVTVRGIEQAQVAPEDAKRLAEQALAAAAAGRIRPVIGQTFPLDRAADAHAAIESRNVLGKTLLLT